MADIRVLLCSSVEFEAAGFQAVFRRDSNMLLLPLCRSVQACAEAIRNEKPHVVIMDMLSGITYNDLYELRGFMSKCKFILWGLELPAGMAFLAMKLGVRAVLRKTLSADLHVKCIENVHSGALWFEKPLIDQIIGSQSVLLTRREGQLVFLLALGASNAQMADKLLITEGTVKIYLSRLFSKMGGSVGRLEVGLLGYKHLGPIRECCSLSTHIPEIRALLVPPFADRSAVADEAGRRPLYSKALL